MPQGSSASATPDPHALFPGAGLLGVLSEELREVIAGEPVWIIRRSQNAFLKISTPLAAQDFTLTVGQTLLIVLRIVGAFVPDEPR